MCGLFCSMVAGVMVVRFYISSAISLLHWLIRVTVAGMQITVVLREALAQQVPTFSAGVSQINPAPSSIVTWIPSFCQICCSAFCSLCCVSGSISCSAFLLPTLCVAAVLAGPSFICCMLQTECACATCGFYAAGWPPLH